MCRARVQDSLVRLENRLPVTVLRCDSGILIYKHCASTILIDLALTGLFGTFREPNHVPIHLLLAGK